MALKDKVSLGVALPHRSPEPIDVAAVRRVAQRAEVLGFRDLWVTENTLDHVFCFDPVVVLTYAAAVTTTIRLGASVVVMAVHSPLMIAHQWASLDYASNGRAILGVGLGREHHYRQFEVPEEGKVTRFREELAVIRSLWSEQRTTFHGRFYNLDNEPMSPKPVQQPMPILRDALEKAGRDPASFPTSKRVFMAVDERPEVARAELHRWFTEVYHNPEGT